MRSHGAIEGTVTVVFTDLVSSTAITSALGDEAAQELLRDHARIIHECVHRHNGREVKSMGDGYMLAFHSCLKALDCARDIQQSQAQRNRLHPDRALFVRIGINAGEALHDKDDYFGGVVNAASRIAGRADGGQVLISEVVKALASTSGHQFVPAGVHDLVGFPEPWTLFELRWRDAESVATTVERSLASQTAFVGRDRELARMKVLLDAATRGRGGVVMLGGEPGVGKSRLADEAIGYARERGFQCYTGHCFESGASAYGPFSEVLTEIVQQTPVARLRKQLGENAPWVAKLTSAVGGKIRGLPPPPLVDPDQERNVLLGAVTSFTLSVSARQPLVMVLEDLHWADPASLLLFNRLTREIRTAPVLVLASYRDTEVAPQHPLADVLAHLHEQHLGEVLSIAPFGKDGVSDMLSALGGEDAPEPLVELIYSETEGNPFFVEEVIKYLTSERRIFDEAGGWSRNARVGSLDVPSSVRLVISRRLAGVRPEARFVLNIAAVIGRTMDLALLECATGLTRAALADALDEAERAHLVAVERTRGGARFSFLHELIRQTLYADLTLLRRQDSHLRCLRAIEDLYPDTLAEHASTLAFHALESGGSVDDEKRRGYLAFAADTALSNSAYEEAARLYEEISEPGTPPELLYKRGIAQWSCERWDDAVASWALAMDRFAAEGDSGGVEKTAHALATLLGWRGRFVEALMAVQRGLAASATSTSDSRSRLLSLAGIMLSLGGQPLAAEPLIAQGLTLARNQPGSALLGNALAANGLHLWVYTKFKESSDSLIEAEGLLRGSGDLSGLVYCSGYLLAPLGYLGRHAEMDERLDEYEALGQRLGAAAGLASQYNYRALLALVRGDLQAAAEWSDTATGIARQSAWLVLPIVLQVAGMIRFLRGDWDEAVEIFREADALQTKMGATPLSYEAWALLMYYEAMNGDADAAKARATRLQGMQASMTCARLDASATAAISYVILGMKEEAAALYPFLAEASDRGVVFLAHTFPLLQRVLGMISAADGRWDDATLHYKAALSDAARLDVAKEDAETRFWHGRMLCERGAIGDAGHGRELMAGAISGYKRIGMPKHAALAERWLSGRTGG